MAQVRQVGNVIVRKYLLTCTDLMTFIGSRISGGSLDIPPNIKEPQKFITFTCNGGPGSTYTPMADERYEFHCYGASQLEADQVFAYLFDALHRDSVKNQRITLEAGKVALIRTAQLVMGPQDLPDPATDWPRVVCAFNVTYYERTFSS